MGSLFFPVGRIRRFRSIRSIRPQQVDQQGHSGEERNFDREQKRVSTSNSGELQAFLGQGARESAQKGSPETRYHTVHPPMVLRCSGTLRFVCGISSCLFRCRRRRHRCAIHGCSTISDGGGLPKRVNLDIPLKDQSRTKQDAKCHHLERRLGLVDDQPATKCGTQCFGLCESVECYGIEMLIRDILQDSLNGVHYRR